VRGEKFKIPIKNICRLQSEICVKATVGYPGSEVMHVLEDVISVPRFAQFVPTSSNDSSASSCNERVEFTISERMQRMILWIRDNFLINYDLDPRTIELKLFFVDASNDGDCLNIQMKNGHVIIETRSIRLAADTIQSMGSYFAFSLLRSTCHFDSVVKIPKIFKQIQLIQAALSRMEAEIAELSQRILADMVRLEDGRIMEDFEGIDKTTASIRLNNNEIIQKYRTKQLNQQELVKLLKQLNSIIDAGSKLRVGSPSSEVLSVCRLAVKNRKPEVITNAILHGVQ
jgi:Bardet-Biedl syndrome 2 protein